MKSNKQVIQIIGTIDEEAYKEFSLTLAEIEAVAKKGTIITIEINSGGGGTYDALAFAAKIRRCSIPIHVVAYGLVASAAVLILAAGHKRYMTKEAWAMVHEDSAKLKGNVVDLEREAGHLRRMEDQWADLLAEVTATDAEFWKQLHKKTTYLSASECLNLGLVDEVI